jgi:DNA-binding CsgD family transcriptional regulator
VHLSEREIDVLCLLAAGNTSLEAAGLLKLSKRTVDGHVAAMLRKAAVRGRMQLIGRAVAHGIIDMSVRPPRWTGRSCLPAPRVPTQLSALRDHGATQHA